MTAQDPPEQDEQPQGEPAAAASAGLASAGPASTRRVRSARPGVDHTGEELAAQRRELGRLEGDLSDLGVTVRNNASLLAETVPRIGELGTALNRVAGRVDELAGHTSDNDQEPDTGPYDEPALIAAGLLPDPGHQVDWHLMSAEQAHPAWEALAAWVAAVVCGRLGFTRAQLPDCWALHPDVVAELSWAHQLHRLYAGARIGPPHLAEWHTRWRPHLRARLAAMLVVDGADPRARARLRSEPEDPRPRCRPGHYHLLPTHEREHAERDLAPRTHHPDPGSDPAPQGFDSSDRSWVTGLISGEVVRTVAAGDLAARDRRRAHAQHELDRHHGHDPGAGRPGPPERPRYLAVHPGDDHPGRPGDPGATRARPGHWLYLYREAAHADLAARRHHQHHHRAAVDLGPPEPVVADS